MKTYTDEKGNIIYVGAGLGGDCYMTFRTPPGKAKRNRVKSPDLPVRGSIGEAFEDLEKYAAKRGWEKREE